jgi:hypothetical protein
MLMLKLYGIHHEDDKPDCAKLTVLVHGTGPLIIASKPGKEGRSLFARRLVAFDCLPFSNLAACTELCGRLQ